eukprot:TRINITY_DN63869_c0_g1_i1.p1 TRINITY_DN63869_c0_g1~~TRINITY_DN63869_c0_g1_i1.p1  ORF type:complete len:421 (+),score=85.60 TRINITY_DN63869_c0_g1_i1:79-1263(+)
MMKRPAASHATGVAKRPTPASAEREQQVDKFAAIKETLLEAEGYPKSVRSMLVACFNEAVGIPRDCRHKSQETLVGWVGEVLASVAKTMQEAVVVSEAQVTEAITERETNAAAEKEALEVLASKNEALDSAKEALVVATSAQRDTKEALAVAENEQIKVDRDLADAAKRQSDLQDSISRLATVLERSPAAPEDIEALLAVGKNVGIEPSMLTALPGALAKTVESRGEFDKIVFDSFERELKQNVANLESVIAAGTEAARDRAAKVADAKLVNEDAVKALNSETESVKEASQNKADAESFVRAAEKSLEQIAPTIKLREERASELRSKLQSFEDKIIAQFKDLESAVSPEEEARRLAATAPTTEGEVAEMSASVLAEETDNMMAVEASASTVFES